MDICLRSLVSMTGGSTRVAVQGIGTDKIVELWSSLVDEIADFENMPYGYCEVKHISVPDEDSYLIIQVDEVRTGMVEDKEKVERR